MIILKHLTVERFRLLRDVNLHFPQRGSILIQGPNEAGKSALLESIYFALYGEPLVSGRKIRSLDDLILYGAPNATVTLTFSVCTTELVVTRTLERGQGQKISLHLYRSGQPPEEPITSLAEANKYIISELGYMDGETLRNSCLVEQKGLGRLESISGSEREATVRKLLGLEQLTRLSDRFAPTSADGQLLQEANAYLCLAEIQQQIPVISKLLEEIETALDAVSVREKLEEISQQEADINEQKQVLEDIKKRRLVLKNSLGRAQHLRKADATLTEIITAYDEMAEARREIPELEKQIAELERRECEELPALEKRVNDLAELTRSFGTLQRMSQDLLSASDTIKELEQELKQQDAAQEDLNGLEAQVNQARARLQQAKQALENLEERRHSGLPQLQSRLESLHYLNERLTVLRQLEEQYVRHTSIKERAETSNQRLEKLRRDLQDTEQELSLVEAEARQIQQQADSVEQRWRKISVRRQVEEWARLTGLAQGFTQAEQHLHMARQQHALINQALMDARNKTSSIMIRAIIGTAVCFLCVIGAFLFISSIPFLAAFLGLLALLAGAFAGYNFYSSNKARQEANASDIQMQDATNRVSMMVAAREAAIRMGGDPEAIRQVEREIRSLGGSTPRSLEEAQRILDQTPDRGESLAELQQRVKEKRDEANAARSQVNVTMEAAAGLRKERAQLEEQRRQEDWDHIEDHLQSDQAAIERMHQEITLLAGQEGLPMPSILLRLQSGVGFDTYSSGQLARVSSEGEQAGLPELEALVESTIKATQRELSSLDGKLDLVTDLENQVRVHQEALDVLLVRQEVALERSIRYQTNSPAIQVERAREQQAALSQALQSLRESLHQRVKPLGVSFGQAAISNAETVARKQLENLQITLGSRIMLQEKQEQYVATLKVRQESLPDLYKLLSKYSNSLGSWIVPPNPFAEALVSLRTRCQRELDEINESAIEKEQEMLQGQEGASKAKTELCKQEIEMAQEYISALLAQHNRPVAKGYTLPELITVWPLLDEYTPADYQRLTEELAEQEKVLAGLEAQEMELSKQLSTGAATLDLEQAQKRKEEQERSFLIKKYGLRLIEAVNERLLGKTRPRTEHYVQQILPLLTSGRYHDVHLISGTDESAGGEGPFQLEVWEAAASEYIPKSELSGGAADQLSLALRLAFAISVLPREIKTAPGFVILDEPLSSFDRDRAQALVDVVTGEILSKHFEQVILISHSNAFDPAMFPYHIYLENGLIVESNLPVVTEVALTEIEPSTEDLPPITPEPEPDSKLEQAMEEEEEDMVTMHVPAITTLVKRNK
jgi:DNA repair exonuclease SbcCD ATPase subunit